MRGATNAILSLSERERLRGVATHSSGNHAQALALAARLTGVKASIVMPENAPEVKINAVKEYGADVVFCAPTLAAREQTLQQVISSTGAIFIHPYNDDRIIAGQSTAAMELHQQVRNLDIMIAPVGGGGLLSGTALSSRYFQPGCLVFGAEPPSAPRRASRRGRLAASLITRRRGFEPSPFWPRAWPCAWNMHDQSHET